MQATKQSGRLYVVATPIGNLDDITLRAIRTLKEVDCIAAEDTRHTRKLLLHLGIDKPMLALHEHNEVEMADKLLSRLQQGERIALVSDAGTPLISDPGYPLVARCRENDVAVEPIPGASAVVAALSVSGLPTDRFVFEGFLPRKQQARLEFLEQKKTQTATQVFYESSHRIRDSLEALCDVMGADRQAVVARELTKMHETVLGGSLGVLLEQVEQDENQRKGEFVLLLAGADEALSPEAADTDRLLQLLLKELPTKKAAAVAAAYTGEKKNQLYERAIALKDQA